jgi:protein-S-isoprenylcysteine O-methyltransferase Ste14
MPRIIEIVLFLTPLLSFAAWRLLFPSPTPPLWLVYSLACVVVLLLLALLWTWHIEAGDAGESYIPARLLDGRVVPAQRAPPP